MKKFIFLFCITLGLAQNNGIRSLNGSLNNSQRLALDTSSSSTSFRWTLSNGVHTLSIPYRIVTVSNFRWNVSGQTVKNDSLRLIAGSNMTLTQSGNTVTFASTGGGSVGNADSLGGQPASDWFLRSDTVGLKSRLLKNADSTSIRTYSDSLYGRKAQTNIWSASNYWTAPQYFRDTIHTKLGIKYYDSNNDLRLKFFGETGQASGIVFYNSELASQILQSGDGYIESLGAFYVRNSESGNSALNVGGAIGQTQPVLNVEQGDSLILRVLPTNRVLIGETTDDSMLTVELGGHFYRGLKVDGATSLGSLSLGTDLTLANIDTSGATGLRSIYVPYSGANASVNLGAQTLTTTGLFSGGAITATGLMTLGSSGSAQAHQANSASATTWFYYRPVSAAQSAAGGIGFAGQTTNGTQVTYSGMQGIVQSGSNSLQSGGISINTRRSGVEYKGLFMDSLQNVFLQTQITSTLSDSRFVIRSNVTGLYAMSVIPAASTTKQFAVDTSGNIRNIGAVATSGLFGVAPFVDTVNYSAVASSIASKNLTATAGMYRISYNLFTRTAGTGGTAQMTLSFNNGNAQTMTSAAINLNSANSMDDDVFVYTVASGTPTVLVTVTGATGSPTYTFRANVERLQ